MLLPLDTLSPQAKHALEARGVKEEDLLLILRMDLDINGRYGEGWLAIDSRRNQLCYLSADHRISAPPNTTGPGSTGQSREHSHKAPPKPEEIAEQAKGFAYYRENDLSQTWSFSVDNFVSSNRLIALCGPKPTLPEDADPDERAEEEKRCRSESHTVVIGFCTNARKNRLFAFLDILNRMSRGDVITEEDAIFEQFRLKCPKCGELYDDQDRRICNKCANKGAIAKRMLKYMYDYRGGLITVITCIFLSAIIQLAMPLINTFFLDQVIEPPSADGTLGQYHSFTWVLIIIAITIGVAVINHCIGGIIQGYAAAKTRIRMATQMKLDIFTNLQRLSLSYYNGARTGGLITRVNSDAGVVVGFLVDGIPGAIYQFFTFITMTIIIFTLNWRLSLIVFLPIPIIVCIYKFVLPKLWRMHGLTWRRGHSLNCILNDSLTGIRVVKAFAKETSETARFSRANDEWYHTHLQASMLSLTIFPVISLIIGLTSRAIWGLGGLEVMGGHMTYGAFSAYISYVGLAFAPLNYFTTLVDQITNTLNCAQRMFEVIDADPEILESKEPVHPERLKGEITFKKVNFHYTPNRPILRDVSFHIQPGDQVGLVGHTGAGKSTIANLINRLYDVNTGTIELDGINIKDLSFDTLHRNIAIVSQEIFLFKGTVAENIAYPRPDAPFEEIVAAAKAANAHDFIMRLPDGYETLIGLGAHSLSGGERQRLSIARALILDPAILILDEATAAMDTETERLIQDALSVLCRGRTTLTIAHRLSTLKDCNYLMAIENGEIAEQGSHEELLEKKGIYYRLYTLQMESMKRVLQGM